MREALLATVVGVPPHLRVDSRQTRVGQGKVRVQVDGAFVHLDGQQHVLVPTASSLVLVPLLVGRVRFHVVGGVVVDTSTLPRREGGLEGGGNFLGNIRLNFKTTVDRPLSIVGVAPQHLVRDRVDQLNVDTYLVTGALHSTGEERGHTKFFANLPRVQESQRIRAPSCAR